MTKGELIVMLTVNYRDVRDDAEVIVRKDDGSFRPVSLVTELVDGNVSRVVITA